MSPQMIEAVRREAFVQGYLRGVAEAEDRRLSDFSDVELLTLTAPADRAYEAYRAERASK